MVKVRCKLVSWDEIVEWCAKLAEKIKESGYKPDIIVAVARGGFTPARLLCDFLGVENLLSIQSQHWTEAAKMAEKAILKFPYTVDLSGKKVLLVDDIADTGESLLLAKKFILENWKPAELRIATMQWISPVCKMKPDYYVEEVKEWIWYQYPWTRLEDTVQFITRFLREEKDKKQEWTYEEIVNTFKEWYGIDVGDFYYRKALEMLVEKGILEKTEREGKVIYRVKSI